jgi:hypothetical protein
MACSGDQDDLPAPAPAPTQTDSGKADVGEAAPPTDARDAADAADGPSACPSISFEKPEAGKTLTNADDKDQDNCAKGFQYDVVVKTSAPSGTAAKLYGGSVLLASANVSGGTVTFADVSLDAMGTTNLKVQVGEPTCTANQNVTVACDPAACSITITKPVISPTHPYLNGVAVAEGGDRVSAPSNPYQAAFEVATSAEPGTTATLTVDGKAAAASAQVAGGKATFPAVTLVPDGDHKVQAFCKKLSGVSGSSAVGIFPVDSVAPDLTVSGVTSGQTVGVGDDIDPNTDGIQFDVCGTTTAKDAIDLPATLGSAKDNLCVKVGTANATCKPVTSSGGNKACVRLDCNTLGSAPQDVAVTLRDAAGNPAKFTATSVKCDTTVPTISIVDPVAYDPKAPTPLILNLSKDKQAAAGLQYTVIACTNANVGTNAKLMWAKGTGTFQAIGSAVPVQAALPADGCPGGQPNSAKFVDATLPDADENADGTLLNPTKLRVDIELGLKTYSSQVNDEWVDATAPAPYMVNVYDPIASKDVGCPSLIQSLQDLTTTARAGCDSNIPIAIRVEHADSTVDTTATVVAGGIGVVIPGVKLKTGANTLRVIGTEPSGNAGQSNPCTMTLGKPPVLAFTSPTGSQIFNLASTDADPGATGFQFDVTLSSDDNADPVSLKIAGQAVGTLTPSGGKVTFPKMTLPEGDAVLLEATQTSAGGTAKPTVTIVVDRHAPTLATNPASSVSDRRAATAGITFLAPSDYDPVTAGVRAAAQYEIRYLKVQSGANCSTAMTDATFPAGVLVPAGGVPAAPGASDTRSVSSLTTGLAYCVGLRASDGAGNSSAVVAFPVVEFGWLSLTLAPPAGAASYGRSVLSDIDLDQDGYYDVVVAGDPNSVWIYYGSASGLESSPSVRIVGTAGVVFGQTLVDLGNFDGSTETKPLPELGVAATLLDNAGGFYIFSLPASLHAQPMTTIQINADGTPQGGTIGAHFFIKPDSAVAALSGSRFGAYSRSIGDFDGDGLPDVIVGAFRYDTDVGRAYLFRGRSSAGLQTLTAPGNCEIEFTVGTPGGYFSFAVAPLGNSGIPAAGGGPGGVAFGLSVYGTNTGGVFAFAGQPVAYGAKLVKPVETSATVSIVGAANEYLGGSLGLVGDVDGDGFDDLFGGNAITPIATLGSGAYTTGYVFYGGISWGSRAQVTNDVGVVGDRFPFLPAQPSLSHKVSARLNADARSDIAFNTYRSSGANTMAGWVVNGRDKLSGTTPISSIGIRLPMPTGTGRGGPALGFAPGAAGSDSWPDIVLGDSEAAGGGRVIVMY